MIQMWYELKLMHSLDAHMLVGQVNLATYLKPCSFTSSIDNITSFALYL